MFCKNCGVKIQDNSKFCSNCGTAVANSDSFSDKPEIIDSMTITMDPVNPNMDSNSGELTLDSLYGISSNSSLFDVPNEAKMSPMFVATPEDIENQKQQDLRKDIIEKNQNKSSSLFDVPGSKEVSPMFKASDENIKKTGLEVARDNIVNESKSNNNSLFDVPKQISNQNKQVNSNQDELSRMLNNSNQVSNANTSSNKFNEVKGVDSTKSMFITPNTINKQQNVNPNRVSVNVNQKNIPPKKKSGFFKKLVFVILILVVFINVRGYLNKIKVENNTRTVMIYMAGADLESEQALGTYDLKSIDYSKTYENNVNVVLMAGGSQAWRNNYVDVSETSIFELKDGGFTKVDVRSQDNMGASDNLLYFLNYVYNNYKTKNYDLIFWNHGAAIDGSEFDTLSGDNLSLADMDAAFSKSPFTGNNKLEIISFRTCLNGTIEVANLYKNYAKYMVASEEVTIGSSVSSALSFINEINGKDDAISVGTKQINAYDSVVYNVCAVNNYEGYCQPSTYSVVDLSKIDKINNSLNLFAEDLNNNLTSNYNEFARIRANMFQYGRDSIAFDMVDLYDLAKKYSSYSKYANQLMSDIDDAVVVNWANSNYSHGLSIYFPYNGSAFLNIYGDVSSANNYGNFINKFYNLKISNIISSYSDFSMLKGKISSIKEDKCDFELQLNDEQVSNFAKAQYYVFVDTKDGYYQILYSGKDVDLDGNTLKAKVQGRQLRFSDIEYDDESVWITSYEEEVTDDYVDVFTYATLHNDVLSNQLARIDIRIDKEHPNGFIRSISSATDNEKKNNNMVAFSPVGLKLSDYIFIEFGGQRYKLLNENGEYNPNWYNEGNGIYNGLELVTDEFKFVKEDFSSDYDYYALFRIWDTSNNSYYSNVVKMNK